MTFFQDGDFIWDSCKMSFCSIFTQYITLERLSFVTFSVWLSSDMFIVCNCFVCILFTLIPEHRTTKKCVVHLSVHQEDKDYIENQCLHFLFARVACFGKYIERKCWCSMTHKLFLSPDRYFMHTPKPFGTFCALKCTSGRKGLHYINV